MVRLPRFDPSLKILLVGMRRIGVDPAYLGTDGDVLPPDPHPVRAIEDRASQRPRRLAADEQYRRLPSPQIMPQMMAKRRHHTAGAMSRSATKKILSARSAPTGTKKTKQREEK